MSVLYIDREGMRLRKYGVTGTGTTTVVKIEIEVTEPTALGFFLRDLADAQAASKAAIKQSPKAKSQRRAVGHREPLALPYYREDDQ